jgi:hypothetical protein
MSNSLTLLSGLVILVTYGNISSKVSMDSLLLGKAVAYEVLP